MSFTTPSSEWSTLCWQADLQIWTFPPGGHFKTSPASQIRTSPGHQFGTSTGWSNRIFLENGLLLLVFNRWLISQTNPYWLSLHVICYNNSIIGSFEVLDMLQKSMKTILANTFLSLTHSSTYWKSYTWVAANFPTIKLLSFPVRLTAKSNLVSLCWRGFSQVMIM